MSIEDLELRGTRREKTRGVSYYLTVTDVDFYDKQILNDYNLGQYGLFFAEFKHNKKFSFNILQRSTYYIPLDGQYPCNLRDSVGTFDNSKSILFRLDRHKIKTVQFTQSGRTDKLLGMIGEPKLSNHPRYQWINFYSRYRMMLGEFGLNEVNYSPLDRASSLLDYECTFCSRVRNNEWGENLGGGCVCSSRMDRVKLISTMYKISLSRDFPIVRYLNSYVEGQQGGVLSGMDLFRSEILFKLDTAIEAGAFDVKLNTFGLIHKYVDPSLSIDFFNMMCSRNLISDVNYLPGLVELSSNHLDESRVNGMAFVIFN